MRDSKRVEGEKRKHKGPEKTDVRGSKKEIMKYGAAATRNRKGPLVDQIDRSWRCTKEGRTVLATGYFLNVGM